VRIPAAGSWRKRRWPSLENPYVDETWRTDGPVSRAYGTPGRKAIEDALGRLWRSTTVGFNRFDDDGGILVMWASASC
jgi:hypothetical protein